MPEFRMPSLGADMEAGTLVEWKVRPGETVARGQVVALVETDKGIIEIEIWQPGVVKEILVPEGERVPVNTVLATLGGEGEAVVAVAPPVAAPPPLVAPPPPPSPPASPAAPSPPAEPATTSAPRASPAARRRARELGVDLATVASGEDGIVKLEDVERAAGARAPSTPAVPPPAPQAPAAAPAPAALSGMRQAIAAAMSRSKREIPHYYLSTDVDMGPALAWLSAFNAARPVEQRVLPAALLLAATARACRDVPEVNGTFVDGAFRPGADVNLGVAIALRGGGLVAPALLRADALGVGALMAALSDLIVRTRRGGLRSSELSEPTITVTNLGDAGVEDVFGVIYPPQVAIVGFGRITERPWASGGLLGVRPVVTATLAADHRVSDGHRGAAFLAAIARRLADPAGWAEGKGDA